MLADDANRKRSHAMRTEKTACERNDLVSCCRVPISRKQSRQHNNIMFQQYLRDVVALESFVAETLSDDDNSLSCRRRRWWERLGSIANPPLYLPRNSGVNGALPMDNANANGPAHVRFSDEAVRVAAALSTSSWSSWSSSVPPSTSLPPSSISSSPSPSISSKGVHRY